MGANVGGNLPSIATGIYKDVLLINSPMLQEGEEEIVVKRIKGIFQ